MLSTIIETIVGAPHFIPIKSTLRLHAFYETSNQVRVLPVYRQQRCSPSHSKHLRASWKRIHCRLANSSQAYARQNGIRLPPIYGGQVFPAMTPPKPTGGSRPGSGRKPSNNATVLLRLPKPLLTELRATVAANKASGVSPVSTLSGEVARRIEFTRTLLALIDAGDGMVGPSPQSRALRAKLEATIMEASKAVDTPCSPITRFLHTTRFL